MSNYNFNKQIDNLCSNEKMFYDENGNWLEFGDFKRTSYKGNSSLVGIGLHHLKPFMF
jgi:hypothetical protein